MNRQNQLLVGVLILQLAIVAFVFWPGRNATAAATALYEGVAQEAIQAMAVSDQSRSVKISRSGDGWVLPEAGDFPVTALQASSAISKVLTIDTRRLVASNPTSHARLGVTEDDFTRRVDLETTDGQTFTLYIGTSPSARSTNVRRSDSNNVYLTSGVTASDLNLDYGSWINTTYLAVPETDIQALTVTNAQDTLEFTRPTTDTWTLTGLAEGETFNQNNLTTVLTRLNNFTMVRPLGKTDQPEYGMATPAATVTIQTQPAGDEAKTITLVIGPQNPDTQNHVVKSSDSEYYVEVAGFGVENFVTRSRTDYLVAPDPAATTPLTDTTFITDFEGITTTTPLTATEPLTATDLLTASGDVTSTIPGTATTPVTTTEIVTTAE